MAARKTLKKKNALATVKLPKFEVAMIAPKIGASYSVAIKALALTFLVIWILIGIFALVIIGAGIRNGAYSGLFQSQGVSQAPNVSQAPSEAPLPGIGTVNVDCVKSALSSASIQKVLDSKSESVLSDAEKAKFDPCVVSREESTPSASPSR